MGGASSFIAILAICGFLSATWLATKFSKALGVSSIVAEIATGVILGPRILGLISDEYAVCEYKTHIQCSTPEAIRTLMASGVALPGDLSYIASKDYCNLDDYGSHSGHGSGHLSGDVSGQASDTSEHGEHGDDDSASRRLSGGGGDYATYEDCLYKSCNSDISHHCGLTPDVFTLIGHTGVALMIFESGMHFDFEKAKVVGPRACVVAVFGTCLPFFTGTLLMLLFGYPAVPDGVAVGTALAPTSVGIALRLLGEAGVLQEDFGQAIITAAFVDDILSLILFNVLFSLRGDFDVMTTVVFPVVGVALMIIAMYLAMAFWPHMINNVLLPRLPQKAAGSKVSSNDEGLFLIMMVVLIVYGTITHFLGTHLWGCFIAGMSFACIDQEGHKGDTHHVWVRQTKRYTSWMIRIFFSCTVAFSIPISELLSFESFWKGSIMGIGPCVLTKVFCAPCMGEARWVIGWAMVGRAEFAYLIAQMAAAGNMIDEKTFSICIWALLYATVLAPFIFRSVLNKYIQSQGLEGCVVRGVVEDETGERDDIFLQAHASKEPQGKRVDVEDGMETVLGRALPPKEKYDNDVDDISKLKAAAARAAQEGGDSSPASPSTTDGSPSRRRLWWGRQPATNVAESQNGFLCCLFFRRIASNS